MTPFKINPITIWLKWYFRTLHLEYKHRDNHLKIGYLSSVHECKFGIYNTLATNVRLCNVEMGNFTYISSNSIIRNTKFGKFCSISENVLCGLGKHPTKFVSTHPIFFSTEGQAQYTFSDRNYFLERDSIEIGNDVWVGANVTILDGIKIGDGAVIGAGAVVTKNVRPYSVVGGIPARLIKYRFEDDEIAFLLAFKWWDKDIEWLKRNFKAFHNINILMAFGHHGHESLSE